MYKICHTEESSRRQRALEQGLLNILGTVPYAKITLTDLCRQLQIPRKTFYRYFPSKEAYAAGGYEARSSNFRPQVSDRIVEGAKALLTELR